MTQDDLTASDSSHSDPHRTEAPAEMTTPEFSSAQTQAAERVAPELPESKEAQSDFLKLLFVEAEIIAQNLKASGTRR
jgi:hypothetical protein